MPIKNKSLADLPVFQTGSQDIVGGTCTRLTQYPDGMKDGWIARLRLHRTFVCVEDLRDAAIQRCKECERPVSYQDTNERGHLVDFQVVCGTKIKFNIIYTEGLTGQVMRCEGCDDLMKFFKLTKEELE